MPVFKKPTVQSILAGFQKTVDQLEAVARDQEQEIAAQMLAMAAAQKAKEEAHVELSSALAVAQKIRALIS